MASCSCKLSAKVSLMLDNPFLVPSLCKLNHISICFIPAYSLQGKQCFFWSHPRCFGPLGKFQHNIKISIKTARVSRLSVSCDYGVFSFKLFSSLILFFLFNSLMSFSKLLEHLVLELFCYTVNTLQMENDLWSNIIFAYIKVYL